MYNRRCGTLSAPETITLISFTIDGTTYQAEEGMTWAEWVESEYNIGGYYAYGIYVRASNGRYLQTGTTNVEVSDVIIAGETVVVATRPTG